MLALALAGLCAGEAAAAQTAAGSRFTPELARRHTVRDALAHLDAHIAEQVDEWIRLTAMPAPSGREAARAQYVRGQLEALSLPVEADSIGNVWTVLRGTGGGPRTVFAAHLDTVHPDGTDLTVRRADSTLHAPGVFDNTASVANLLAVARAWRAAGLQTRGDVVLLWTVQEELGLRGMAYWMDRQTADLLVAVDGELGPVRYGALGIYLHAWCSQVPARTPTRRAASRIRPARRPGFLPLMMILGIVDGLVLLQPDLSVVLTAAMVALAMFYLAGAKTAQSLVITLGGGVVGYILVLVTQTGRARWDLFIAGLIDVDKASYHVQHSLQALYAGGIFGRGLGASREKFGLLPAPHTDSIFAIIGEELGLFGALLVIALFALLMVRGFRIAQASPDKLTQLLAAGITFYIGIQALINMSVLLGLLPFAGNALPFFSYGGSNLTSTLAATGILLNISRRKPLEVGPTDYAATVGIGWRYRRRRVSRLSHRRRPARAS